MSSRIYTAAIAATAGGGLLTAAFLQAAVAVAAPEGGSDAGFTIDGLSFTDPVALPGFGGGEPTPGYETLFPFFSVSPLLATASDKPLGLFPAGSQQFTVEDSSGTTLGTVDTHVNDQSLLGIQTAQFTVFGTDPASGLTDSQAAELPDDGTVYSITDLGGGFANVYEADPNADGTAASSITDTLVTPFGNFNVPTSYDAIAPLDPAAPFEALGSTSSNPDVSDNAFTIGGTTFDPGSDGFNTPTFSDLFSVAPLLHFGAGTLALSQLGTAPSQPLEVYSSGADDGTVHTSLFESDILGIDSTQLTVQYFTPPVAVIQSALADNLNFGSADFTAQELASVLHANSNAGVTSVIRFGTGDITSNDIHTLLAGSGIDLSGSGITNGDIADVLNNVSAADLPALGTVYSVTDLGNGYENVYVAVPGTDGGSATITDTLVTPFGNFDVPTPYDATAPLDPAAPLGALAATSSNASLSDNAFTIDGTTFDPGSAGFTPINDPLFAIAPLLEIGGGLNAGFPLVTQDGVEVYHSGTDLGSVDFGENVSNILGFIDTTQFTVHSVDPAEGLTDSQAAELPDVGTVYSVTEFGSGFTNVYEAIPNADGTAASSITDTLITPFGNFDLSTMFDAAIAGLDVGDAAAGVDASGSAADSASAVDLFDPSTWF
jgi:hypothetical protein